MEKLREQIQSKIPKENDCSNTIFKREVEFQICSNVNQIKDTFFAQGGTGAGTARSSAAGSMDFAEDGQEHKNKEGTKLLETFIRAQMDDKQNVPPIRIVVAGDDKFFLKFVQQYVTLLELD